MKFLEEPAPWVAFAIVGVVLSIGLSVVAGDFVKGWRDAAIVKAGGNLAVIQCARHGRLQEPESCRQLLSKLRDSE